MLMLWYLDYRFELLLAREMYYMDIICIQKRSSKSVLFRRVSTLIFFSIRKIQSCTIYSKSLVILFVERCKPANIQKGG